MLDQVFISNIDTLRHLLRAEQWDKPWHLLSFSDLVLIHPLIELLKRKINPTTA